MLSSKEFSEAQEHSRTFSGRLSCLQIVRKIRELFQPRETLETNYEQLGDVSDFMPAYLAEIKDSQQKEPVHANYHLAFYLNSSDSLLSLDQLQQKGERIMTVAGSGEFAHAFIRNGASEIYSFDISPAGAFNAELRHVALCNLSMEGYLKLFSGWTQGWETDNDDHFIYDLNSYLKHEFRTFHVV